MGSYAIAAQQQMSQDNDDSGRVKLLVLAGSGEPVDVPSLKHNGWLDGRERGGPSCAWTGWPRETPAAQS